MEYADAQGEQRPAELSLGKFQKTTIDARVSSIEDCLYVGMEGHEISTWEVAYVLLLLFEPGVVTLVTLQPMYGLMLHTQFYQ